MAALQDSALYNSSPLLMKLLYEDAIISSTKDRGRAFLLANAAAFSLSFLATTADILGGEGGGGGFAFASLRFNSSCSAIAA